MSAAPSLRRQLMAPLLAATLISSTVTALLIENGVGTLVNQLCDNQLRSIAATITDEPPAAIKARGWDVDLNGYFVVQIWDRGRLSYQSDGLPAPPPRALDFDMGPPKLETLEGTDDRWRSFTRRNGNILVQVAQPLQARRSLAALLVWHALLPLLLPIPVLGLFIWALIARRMVPIQQFTDLLRARQAHNFAAIDIPALPNEFEPVIDALNDLLARLGRALEAQRRFVADAAHELRTPLTIVSLQAQESERASVPQEREDALVHLRASVARASHVVQQMLTLARLEPGANDQPLAPLQLDVLARQSAAEHFFLARNAGLEIRCDADLPVWISGNTDSLSILLGTLIENAVNYVPAGGSIELRVCIERGLAVLEVIDDGPGIPPQERQRVFDRFYRGASARLQPASPPSRDAAAQDPADPRPPYAAGNGSGLGLSIAATIAAQHRGTLTLHDGNGAQGLRVRLSLPVARHDAVDSRPDPER